MEKEVSQLKSKNAELQAKVDQERTERDTMAFTKLRLEEQVAVKEARVKRLNEETMISEELLKKKDITIASVSEQLLKTREYLATRKQVHTCMFM